MKHEYKNRYGDIYTFTKLEDDSILMEGEFKWIKSSDSHIDPSGGPFIHIGQMLCHVIGGEINDIVDGFERVDEGYLIKTKPHKYDPNDMSHLADTKIIGGIINTTEK